MLCSCGCSDFKSGTKRKRLDKDLIYDLFFEVCSSCGRVGNERLMRNGLPLLSGVKAREAFKRS